MIKPLNNWFVTSPFGYRVHPITGENKLHNGIDLRATINTPIYSPANGFIEDVNYNSSGGNQIFVKHDNNYRTTYSHLESTTKNTNDRVIKGELIGFTGESGNVTAPHLHYTVKYNGVRIDPETVIYEDPYNIIGNYNFNNNLQPNFKKYAIWLLVLMGFSLTYILYKRKNV